MACDWEVKMKANNLKLTKKVKFAHVLLNESRIIFLLPHILSFKKSESNS